MLPQCEEKTIIATFERAQARQKIDEYTPHDDEKDAQGQPAIAGSSVYHP